jgi:uncharacterized protein
METLNCPKCGTEMTLRMRAYSEVHQCPEGHGVFLERADLGTLIEAETDWHARSVQDTAQLPRITGDMTAPPVAPKRARAWIETLFD